MNELQNALRRLTNSSFVGFGPTFTLIDSAASTQRDVKFPRYNIISPSENSYVIEVALAGFKKDDISITLQNKNALPELVIAGKAGLEHSPETYLRKMISSRDFTLEFTLEKNLKVGDVTFEDGLLSIRLNLEVPEEEKPVVIDIK